MKTTSIILFAVGLVMAATSTAAAQTNVTSPGFLDVNIGAQLTSRSLTTSATFPLYDETAAIATSQQIDAGPMFDIRGGYRVRNNVSVGVGLSIFSRSSDGIAALTIPNPARFNDPATVTLTQSDLKHSELGVHLMVVWTSPMIDRINIAVSGGPSFIRLRQDLITASVVSGTQTATSTVSSESGVAMGGNVGIDAIYMVTPRYGVGLAIGYAGGSADLDSVENQKVGGFRIGGGARLRF
jgi:hypothetical protein